MGLGNQFCLQCRSFRGKPSRAQWEALVDRLATLPALFAINLAVIDALAAFNPNRDENNARF